jgi:ectoine hydroxylase-related dioxygenase (phytanoyl-CoA dioxygenase family)
MSEFQLTEEQFQHYAREGYVFIENVLTLEEIEEVRDRVDGLLEGRYDSTGFIAGAASNNRQDDPGRLIKQVMPKVKPIPDPIMRKYSEHPALRSIAAQLMEVSDCELFQQQALVKEPGHPNGTPWHQDEYYWKNGGNRITAWFPLEPLTPENGSMSFFPGTHKGEKIEHGRADGISDFHTIRKSLDESKAIPVLIPLGAVSFHHQRLIHGAFPNKGNSRRIALAQHFVEKQ